MKKRILVLGATGFLGRKAMEILGKTNEVIGVSESHKSESIFKADMTNKDEILKIIEEYKPDIIFNSAALINLDFCEDEKEKALTVNALGPLYLAEICKEKNIKLILISSDYIFSGDNSPYYEDTAAHPKNFYGITKLVMEQIVKHINSDALILRPSILYGCSNSQKTDKLITLIINLLNKGKEIYIEDFRPKYPVLIDDLVKNALILIKKNERGVFNFASVKPINRLEMAKVVARIFGLNETLIKEGCPKEFRDKPYNVQLINKNAPSLNFSSFEEGVKIIKSQMEKNEDY